VSPTYLLDPNCECVYRVFEMIDPFDDCDVLLRCTDTHSPYFVLGLAKECSDSGDLRPTRDAVAGDPRGQRLLADPNGFGRLTLCEIEFPDFRDQDRAKISAGFQPEPLVSVLCGSSPLSTMIPPVALYVHSHMGNSMVDRR
jgi:hypothetical protein